MKAIILSAIVLVANIACAKQGQCGRDPTVRSLAYFGHRLKSTSSNDIENSMQALRNAIRDDFIIVQYEFDLRVTKDKQIIVMHDDTTCATTGIRASVKGNEYKDLPILLDGSDIPLFTDFASYIVERYKDITKPVLLDTKDIGWAKEKFVEVANIMNKWVKVEVTMEGGLVKNNDVPFLCANLDKTIVVRQFDPYVKDLCHRK